MILSLTLRRILKMDPGTIPRILMMILRKVSIGRIPRKIWKFLKKKWSLLL